MRFTPILALASSAASASAATIKVVVGANGTNTFTPANFTANIGDMVLFEFHSKNHTVSQSTFANPCTQFVNATTAIEVNSGFKPVAANSSAFPTFSIQVNSTSPFWFYCAQVGHCAKGMVGAINAPTTGNTFDAFVAKALASGTTPSNSTSTPSGTNTPTGSGSSSTPTKSNGALPRLSSVGNVILVSLVGTGLGLML